MNATPPSDVAIDQVLLELATARGVEKAFCPSEAARALAEDWRPLMPRIRSRASRLASGGRLVALQGGQPVEAMTARGPIRLQVTSDGRGRHAGDDSPGAS